MVVTVLADVDKDGMLDLWEASHGFNTNSPADATIDLDGDGVSNRNEPRKLALGIAESIVKSFRLRALSRITGVSSLRRCATHMASRVQAELGMRCVRSVSSSSSASGWLT